ncbi:sugar kinase [Shouchella patagoniensis]|uniref:sugar kinase n=1 Tax=Shouchella patagoniensis TaxID=228576 RepID=UPI00099542B3|nr:sugar kinase [Shouchella patagoniensis]
MIYAFGEVMMRLEAPQYQKLPQASSLLVSYSGTGVNVLSGLSHFGHETAMITKLPNNSLGAAAKSYLQSLGIQTGQSIYGGNTLGLYFLERGFGGRTSTVTYTDRSQSSFCTSQLDEFDLDSLDAASLIHFCGISLAVSAHTRKLTLAVARKAKERGLTISFDCNYRPKLWTNGYAEAQPVYEEMLRLADICFITEADAKLILGFKTTYLHKKEQIGDLLPRVAQTFHIQLIAGTIRAVKSVSEQTLIGFLVKDGSVTYSHMHHLHVLDRIGGGDGFASGVLHGLQTKMPPEEWIEFATSAGVLAHTTVGDSPVSTITDVLRLKQTLDLER